MESSDHPYFAIKVSIGSLCFNPSFHEHYGVIQFGCPSDFKNALVYVISCMVHSFKVYAHKLFRQFMLKKYICTLKILELSYGQL